MRVPSQPSRTQKKVFILLDTDSTWLSKRLFAASEIHHVIIQNELAATSPTRSFLMLRLPQNNREVWDYSRCRHFWLRLETNLCFLAGGVLLPPKIKRFNYKHLFRLLKSCFASFLCADGYLNLLCTAMHECWSINRTNWAQEAWGEKESPLNPPIMNLTSIKVQSTPFFKGFQAWHKSPRLKWMRYHTHIVQSCKNFRDGSCYLLFHYSFWLSGSKKSGSISSP